MDDAEKNAFKALLREAEPDDIPVSVYGMQAYELARAMFVVLAREKGPAFAEHVRNEMGRRAAELTDCGHPWEEQVAKELGETQFADFWNEVGISGVFPDDDAEPSQSS
ncbi:hypothetical protein [uncultured Sphingomonas sp.]|uniref:hypothetical protein n=1 Tax=uncultured Sphingomonas sp. TaxID=158754 RepID=UPI0025F32F90|nr:hypothetical protein [uncultured Sphingomonas sp.]